jgi:uncharacterized protein YbcI
MGGKSRGELEAEFTRAVIKFEKEYLGRGPLEARTFFVSDMVLIRLRGVLTPAEQTLSSNREGQRLVKETRRQLFETARPILSSIVEEILDCKMLSLHSDISTRSGERVIVLTLDVNLDQVFLRGEGPQKSLD